MKTSAKGKLPANLRNMRPTLGQHFLVNRNIADKMVQRFLPVEGPILEIGPGPGILTGRLVEGCRDNRITVVERDRTLSRQLMDQWKDQIDIIHRDILQIDLDEYFPGAQEAVNLIGNLPYYISKELLDWVIAHRGKIKKGMFMVQKEFLEKLLMGASAQAVLFRGLFRVEKWFEVQPGSFSPPPKVKSAVFLFERKETVLAKDIKIDDFYRFLKGCYRNRRKTLVNNLAISKDKKSISDILDRLGIDPGIRAEQLGLEDFLKIYTQGFI